MFQCRLQDFPIHDRTPGLIQNHEILIGHAVFVVLQTPIISPSHTSLMPLGVSTSLLAQVGHSLRCGSSL